MRAERLAVFGYGSLVSRASIAQTLGHEAPAPIPARLAGWRRRWSIFRRNTAHEKVFERADGEPFEHVVGLNLERAPDAPEADWPNGAVIALTEEELGRLDLREVRYDRVDVTDGVRVSAHTSQFDRVYAFIAKPGHFAAETPPDSIVIASYVEACKAAFNELGPDAWELFEATTGEPPAPVVDARLVADSIPEGNPRGW
ncbi:MAG: gamma-glutamylcyclotransferase [Actinomycetota bacterium]|nr:gamma-glutamylcyclotransferase [Actinomycetota bacterium]